MKYIYIVFIFFYSCNSGSIYMKNMNEHNDIRQRGSYQNSYYYDRNHEVDEQQRERENEQEERENEQCEDCKLYKIL